MRRTCIALLASVIFSLAANPQVLPEEQPSPSPVICDFHSHSAKWEGVSDSGTVLPSKQVETRKAAGYHYAFWTPHSNMACPKGGDHSPLAKLLARQLLLESDGLRWFMGTEYHVENGPRYSGGMLGNNNHLTFVAFRDPIPDGLSYAAAIEYLHAQGGLTFVNHPGPGPLEWESGYYEAAHRLRLLDGFECFNGRLVEVGQLEDGTYRELLKTHPLTAAIGSTDYHYPTDPLGTCTAVYADGDSLGAIVKAVRERRTVACTSASLAPRRVLHLGEVIVSKEKVKLEIDLGYEADKVFLFEGDKPVRTAGGFGNVYAMAEPNDGTPYTWVVERGTGRVQTSGIIVRREGQRLPDFVVSATEESVVVKNIGRADGACDVAVFDALPHKGGKRVELLSVTIKAGGEHRLPVRCVKGWYVVANPQGYGYSDPGPKSEESDYRNNAALVQ